MVKAPAKGRVVAIGGPPHSGKSVFVSALYKKLLKQNLCVFRQPACPDGEGVWSYEADPAAVAKLRRKYGYTPQFVDFIKQAIENLRRSKDCTLLDLGGLRAPPNEEFLRLSTHLIVLSADEAEARAWQRYGEAEGCRTLAVIISRLFRTDRGDLDTSRRTPDRIWQGEVPLHAEIWQLDRSGPETLYGDAVAGFADWLWRQVGESSR